jgi:outer membrane protein OmpA-like peptidoglycan-associated protein
VAAGRSTIERIDTTSEIKMRVTRLILSGAAISAIAYVHPAIAREDLARDSAPIVVAQQDKNQQDQKKNKDKSNREQRGDQKKEQRQEGRGQERQQRQDQKRDQAQERRDQRKQQGQQQQQRQQDLQQRDQRKDAKEDQRKDRREDAKDQRKDRRDDAKDQRKDRRDDAKDQRQDRRDDARDQRKDRRDDAKDQRQDRRDDAKDQRQDRRDDRQDTRKDQRDDRDRRNDRARRLDDVRGERRERREGNRTIIQEGNRTIVREGNRTIIRRDESDRFRRFGRDVDVRRVGGETRTVVVGPNGQRIVTVTDANGRLLRRSRFDNNNREVIIIDNRPRGGRRADAFFVALPALAIASLAIPRDRYIVEAESAPPEYIYGALMAPPVERLPRAYTLDEIRYSPEVRDRMPRIDLDTITFDSGSWEISPDQYNRLAPIADGIKRAVAQNPNEVFLVEGHTDATGTEEDNLSLSDRRAESVSIILTDQFQIPPENLTTQGYGEQQLKVATEGPERANRRVTMRRITPLLQQGQAAGGPAPQ